MTKVDAVTPTTETSAHQERHAFLMFIESAAGINPDARALVAAVANCTRMVPDPIAGLLDLPSGATYAQAAARCQERWAAGRSAV